jgi:hypothetical protein
MPESKGATVSFEQTEVGFDSYEEHQILLNGDAEG